MATFYHKVSSDPNIVPIGTPLDIVCAANWFTGCWFPTYRVARAIADRPSVKKVSLLVDSYTGEKVAKMLKADPDKTGKFKIVCFSAGQYIDAAIEEEINKALCKGETNPPFESWHKCAMANARPIMETLAKETHHFVIESLSPAFTTILADLGTASKVSISHVGTAETVREVFGGGVGPDVPWGRRTKLAALRKIMPLAFPFSKKLAIHMRGPEPGKKYPWLCHDMPGMTPPWMQPPNVISCGLVACPSSNGLCAVPVEFQDFINKPGPPIILVSLGSTTILNKEQVNKFKEGLSAPGEWRAIWSLSEKSQQLVEGGFGDPEQLLVSKWVPQADLLMHPTIKAFVSHTGYGGTCEAIVSGKPVVSFATNKASDQPSNGNLLSRMGMAKVVGLPRATLETVVEMSLVNHCMMDTFKPADINEAIREVLADKSYADAASYWQGMATLYGSGGPKIAEKVEQFCYYGSDGICYKAKTATPGCFTGLIRKLLCV